MKFLVFIFLFTASFESFSGQEGSGENICPVTVDCDSGECTEYRTFDELSFPEYIGSRDFSKSPLEFNSNSPYIDLTQTKAGKLAMNKFARVVAQDSSLETYLHRLFSKLIFLRSVSGRFYRSFTGDNSVSGPCDSQLARAVLVSWPDSSGSVLAVSDWNTLDLTSQTIAIIHEVLRFDQHSEKRFQISSERQLELTTMQIYAEKFRQARVFGTLNYFNAREGLPLNYEDVRWTEMNSLIGQQDCVAIVRKRRDMCSSRDCEAIVSMDARMCQTKTCLAIANSSPGQCDHADCVAILSKNPAICTSSNCIAVITSNEFLCKEE